MISLQKIRKQSFLEFLESIDGSFGDINLDDKSKLDTNNQFQSEATAYLNSLYTDFGDLL